MSESNFPNIIVINFYGGFPSLMIETAMKRLKSFQILQQFSTLYDKAYVTNLNSEEAFRNFITGYNENELQEGLFQKLKHQGYKTQLKGCYGLKQVCLNENQISNISDIGIDVFDDKDAKFIPNCNICTDIEIMKKTYDCVKSWPQKKSQFVMANLKGCEIIENLQSKEEIENMKKNFCKICNFEEFQMGFDYFPDTMTRFDDDFKDTQTRELSELKTIHDLAWNILRIFDRELLYLIDELQQTNIFEDTMIILMATHATSLYEYGIMKNPSPREVSTRSFVIIKEPSQKNALRYDESISLFAVTPTIIHKIGIKQLYGIERLPMSCGMHSSISSYFSEYDDYSFVKMILYMHERYFSVSVLFKKMKLIEDGKFIQNLSFKTSEFPIRIFDQGEDIEETINLAQDESWLNSETCADLNYLFLQNINFYYFRIPQYNKNKNPSSIFYEAISLIIIRESNVIYDEFEFLPITELTETIVKGKRQENINIKKLGEFLFANNHKIIDSKLKFNETNNRFEMIHIIEQKNEKEKLKRTNSFERHSLKKENLSSISKPKGSIKTLELKKVRR